LGCSRNGTGPEIALGTLIAIATGIVWLTPRPVAAIPLGLFGLLQLAFTTQAKADSSDQESRFLDRCGKRYRRERS
jgi:hypothetical protein